MSHLFAIGDTAKIKRSGLEVEVTGLHPNTASMVLCGWFDTTEMWWEVFFNVADIELVKAKEQPADPSLADYEPVGAAIPEKPARRAKKERQSDMKST